MSRRVNLDANVILRFLRNDDVRQSPRAAALFQLAQADDELELLVSPVTLLEVFYVLVRAYGLPRTEVAGLLGSLLGSGTVLCEDGGITLSALKLITSNQISFGDAYLAATALQAGEEIASFDQGMSAFKAVRHYPLGALGRKRG